MKKRFFMLMAAMATVFASCDEKVTSDPMLSIQDEQGMALTKLDFTAAEGDATFIVVTNASFTASCEDNWVTLTYDASKVQEGVEARVAVNVHVDPYNSKEAPRSATINISAGKLSGNVKVNQASVPVQYAMGTASFNADEITWTISLMADDFDSDTMSGLMARFIISVDENATFEGGIPAGSFEYLGDSATYMELAGLVQYENEEMVNMTFFEEGSLTISKDGENYTLAARGTDEDGNEMNIDYTGVLILSESAGGAGDIYGDPIELTFAIAGGTFDGLAADESCANWSLSMMDATMSTVGMIALRCAPTATFDKGLPTGTFNIDTTEKPALDVATNVIYINSSTGNMGGIPTGTVTITKNTDETYTIVAEGPVGDGTSRYTFTGAVNLMDGTIGGEDEL